MALAQALYDQANDLQKNGAGTGIDTLRSNVELQNETQRLLAARTDHDVTIFNSSGCLGGSSQSIELSDEMSFYETPVISVEASLDKAWQSRPEMRQINESVRAAESRKSAAWDMHLPTFDANGFWEEQGLTAGSVIPVYQYVAEMKVPIFSGNRTHAAVNEADLEIQKLKQQRIDVRNQIAVEVRTASAQLESARKQVEVANEGIKLAQEEVQQARDRFAAGVANNVEVVQAQDALSQPATTRSRLSINTTQLAPIWPIPPARWKLYTQNKTRGIWQLASLNLKQKAAQPSPQAGVSQRPAPAAGQLRAEDKPSLISQPRARGFIFASVIVLLVLGVLVFWYYHGRESTDDAEVDGHLAPISSKVSGNVLQVLVDDNQLVKTGQVLVKLDPRDYQEAVEQATASLALAKAHAQSANAGVPLQQETTQTGESSASANLEAAFAQQSGAEISYQKSLTSDLAYANAQVSKEQAAFDKAHNDVVRMRPLAEKAEISAQEFDGYVTTERQAESELESAKQKLAQAEQDSNSSKASLDAAHSKVTVAKAQVAQSKANEKQVVERVADAAAAKASIAQAQANLDAANLNLSYTTVVAPVDGVVTRKTVEVGQVLQPGQGLLVVVPLKDVWVTANFKETQLKHVVPGQKKGRNSCGYVWRNFHWPRGFHRRSNWLAFKPAASGKRNRQLCKSGATHSRKDRARSRSSRQSNSQAGDECGRHHPYSIGAT